MGTNFRPKESRGLQDVGNPPDRDSVFSEGPTQPFSYSNLEIQELGTEHPEMSILQPESGAGLGLNSAALNRPGHPRHAAAPASLGDAFFTNNAGPVPNSSFGTAESRIPTPTEMPGQHPTTPNYTAYRYPGLGGVRGRANPLATDRRGLFNRGAFRDSFSREHRGLFSSRDPSVRDRSRDIPVGNPGTREVPKRETVRDEAGREGLGPRKVPARRDARGNPVSRVEQYKMQPLSLTHAQRRAMSDIYADLRQAGFEVPVVPKLLPAHDIYMAFAHYYSRISPLPTSFEPNPAGVMTLLALLDYGKDGSPPEATAEPLVFALQLPDRNSTWPLVLSALNWLRSVVRENHAIDTLPDLTDVDVSSFNFEQFLEYAEFSAYGLLRENGQIEPSFDTELDLSLQSRIDQDAEEVTGLETHLANVKNVRDEIVSMAGQLDDQTSQIAALEAELATLEKDEARLNEEAMAKNQEIARLASDLDIEMQRLGQAESEVHRAFAEIARKEAENTGMITMEATLELAEKFKGLQQELTALDHKVKATSAEMSLEYERPAREKLTVVRISVDDYNNRLSNLIYAPQDEEVTGIQVPDDLIIKGEVPRLVESTAETATLSGLATPSSANGQSIWGKSVSELLNTDQDLGQINRAWLKLQAYEQNLRAQVEDDSKEMDTEIPSLETRKVNNENQLKKLTNEMQYLDSVRIKTNETLVERRLQLESQHRAKEALAEKWMVLKRSLEQKRALLIKLEDEKSKNEARIREKIPYKQRVEEALLDHQTARKILNDKIEELSEATDKMKPATESAQQLLADLTPDYSLPPAPQETPRECALRMINTSGR